MASTWTSNNAIEKIADGEKTNTWGQITNRNFDIVDQAINGVVAIDLADLTAKDLDTDNGTTSFSGTIGDAVSDGVNKVLVFSSSTSNTNACTITIQPNNVEKFYLVNNTSGKELTFSQGTGDDAVVAANSKNFIYCDGAGAAANVYKVLDATTLTDLGITATAAELNYNDITTLGTSEASKVVTADANGDVKFANAIVETVYDLTGTSLDPNNGTVQTKTISANTTFTDNLAAGESMSLHLTSASSYTITWPTITWITSSGNTAPTLTAADTVVLFKISTTLYGVWIGSSA